MLIILPLLILHLHFFIFFFFNDTATTEIYTLSLHDALPICRRRRASWAGGRTCGGRARSSSRGTASRRPWAPAGRLFLGGWVFETKAGAGPGFIRGYGAGGGWGPLFRRSTRDVDTALAPAS